jgi:hypothetical protein
MSQRACSQTVPTPAFAAAGRFVAATTKTSTTKKTLA